MKTRAAVLGRTGWAGPFSESRPLEVVELQLDPPGPGELLVEIRAAGVCHSDLSVVDGSRQRPVPMALGHEAAGVVEAVGVGVTDVRPGDHVILTFVPSCGMCPSCSAGRPALCGPAAIANASGELRGGGFRLHRDGTDVHHHLGVSAFADRAVVSRGSAVVVSPDLPWDVAALFGCAILTGVGSVLNVAAVRPGDSVAVFGLGAVGLAAVLGSVVASAAVIVAVDPIEHKRQLASDLGATHVIDSDDAVAAIREITGGGAEHVIEAAGHPAALEAAYRATGRGGKTVAAGLPHPDATLTIPAVSLAGEGRHLIGSYMGDSSPHRDIPRLIELWRSGRLPVERLHTGTLELADVNVALDLLASGEAIRTTLRPQPASTG